MWGGGVKEPRPDLWKHPRASPCTVHVSLQALWKIPKAATMSVTLHTTHGDMKIEIFCESVPKTAEVRFITPPSVNIAAPRRIMIQVPIK
jgi:hypothetical protein